MGEILVDGICRSKINVLFAKSTQLAKAPFDALRAGDMVTPEGK